MCRCVSRGQRCITWAWPGAEMHHLSVASRDSMTMSPGSPFCSRLSRAALLDLANSERPKPMREMKERREERKPCQW